MRIRLAPPFKRQVSIGIVTSVILLLGYFVATNVKMFQKRSSLSIKVITTEDQTKLYSYKAEYPQFQGVPSEFNAAITTSVKGRIDNFKKVADENWRLRLQNAEPGETVPQFPDEPFPFILSWTPQQLNNTYVSFIMHITQYVGGANEIEDFESFNYDVRKKEFIKLSDLFPGKYNYLTTISEFSRADLVTQLKGSCTTLEEVPEEMVAEGTSPKEENFKRFTFDDDTLLFYFPKGQVAPGVYGDQKVIIGRKSFNL